MNGLSPFFSPPRLSRGRRPRPPFPFSFFSSSAAAYRLIYPSRQGSFPAANSLLCVLFALLSNPLALCEQLLFFIVIRGRKRSFFVPPCARSSGRGTLSPFFCGATQGTFLTERECMNSPFFFDSSEGDLRDSLLFFSPSRTFRQGGNLWNSLVPFFLGNLRHSSSSFRIDGGPFLLAARLRPYSPGIISSTYSIFTCSFFPSPPLHRGVEHDPRWWPCRR